MGTPAAKESPLSFHPECKAGSPPAPRGRQDLFLGCLLRVGSRVRLAPCLLTGSQACLPLSSPPGLLRCIGQGQNGLPGFNHSNSHPFAVQKTFSPIVCHYEQPLLTLYTAGLSKFVN